MTLHEISNRPALTPAGACFTRALVVTGVLIAISGSAGFADDATSGVAAQEAVTADLVPAAAVTDPAAVSGDIDDLRDRALRAGWSESDVAAVVNLARALAREGLPFEPVLDRARQGLAKGAPVSRVRSVCDLLNDRIRAGAALVDAAFPDAARVKTRPGEPLYKERVELVDRTAFALEKGVPPTSLNAVFQRTRVSGSDAAQLDAMGAPILALTSLTAEGVPPAEGVDFVTHVSRRGISGKDLEDLGMAVGQAMRGGRSAEVLALVIDSLDRGIPPGQVIRELHGWRGRDDGQPGLGTGGPSGPGLGRPGDGGPPADPGRRGRSRGGRRRN